MELLSLNFRYIIVTLLWSPKCLDFAVNASILYCWVTDKRGILDFMLNYMYILH